MYIVTAIRIHTQSLPLNCPATRDAGLSTIGRMLVGPHHIQDSLLASHPESRKLSTSSVAPEYCVKTMVQTRRCSILIPRYRLFPSPVQHVPGLTSYYPTIGCDVDGVDNTGNICGWGSKHSQLNGDDLSIVDGFFTLSRRSLLNYTTATGRHGVNYHTRE